MTRNELEILRVAILNENEGRAFYELAARNAEGEEVRQVFLHLAADEQRHEDWLRALYQGISDGQVKAEELTPPDVESPGVFVPERVALEAGSLMVSALHIGIMMEKASMDYYREAAAKTQVGEARRLYEHLASWEREHLERLEQAYDVAREEWFEQQGFSPS